MKVPVLHLSLLFFEALATGVLEAIVGPLTKLVTFATVLSLGLKRSALSILLLNNSAEFVDIDTLEGIGRLGKILRWGRRHVWARVLDIGMRASSAAHRVASLALSGTALLSDGLLRLLVFGR